MRRSIEEWLAIAAAGLGVVALAVFAASIALLGVGAPRGRGQHQFEAPGFAFQRCRFSSEPPVWSISVSLLAPAALALAAAVLIVRRLWRRPPRATPKRVETA